MNKSRIKRTKAKLSASSASDMTGSQLANRQSLLDGLNDFSDALSARDDTFHCDRRNMWGDRISIQLVRRTRIEQS
jgi:ABC-type transporter Mla subunit MlaD